MSTQDTPHASLLAAAHADPKRRARLTSHAALLAANVLFGVGNIVSKVGLQATNPIVFALLREVVSGPLLLLISMRIERDSPVEQEGSAEAPAPGTKWEQIKRLRWRLLLNGGALWGTNLCYIVGVKLAGPTIGSIWQSAQPVTLTLMAVALRFEGCTAYKAGGIVLAFSGCLFVSVWGSAFQSDGLANMVIGNLVFFLQNLCISVYCLSQKQILRTFPPIAALAYAYFVASLLMAAVAGGISASPEALHRLCSDCKGNGWDIPVDAILAIAYWVVFGSMIGYFCCAWGNQHVHASVVGIYGSVQPVVTIIVAQLVIGLSQPPHFGLSTVNWVRGTLAPSLKCRSDLRPTLVRWPSLLVSG
ncbi:hypothetical protein AB1Y20_021182 [Prymnesium parvum]|uniref:EamA domain-containing protein n=1 Tax=Prymnesium parvum TaxID=97485 RepID=A0AB34JIV6_PRYPA